MTKLSELRKGFSKNKASELRYLCETSKIKAVKGPGNEYYINDIKQVRRVFSILYGKT